MIYSTCVVAYRIYEPRDNQTTTDTSSMLAYDSLKSYVKDSSSNIHYFLFYSALNNNSIYLKDTILNIVETDINKSLSNIIEVVDITELDQKMETKRLSEDWQISSYPAFVSVSNNNGEIIINNKLEWTNEKAITTTDVEEWLTLNGITE